MSGDATPTAGVASQLRITHVGGPTALIEFGGWRLLTDPTFDAPGRRYTFAPGLASRKLSGPALTPAQIGAIDAVLLSHDHHADNLDPTGRTLLPGAGVVLTTSAGARRLGANAVGLAPWETYTLTESGRPTVTVTATPARHGIAGSERLVGPVIGFALQWDGQAYGSVWISGDTVWFAGVREVVRRLAVGTAILHLGGVRFGLTGPVRYTMSAGEAVRVTEAMAPHTVVPIHYEGWAHFREGREAIEPAFDAAGLGERVRWLQAGVPSEISV